MKRWLTEFSFDNVAMLNVRVNVATPAGRRACKLDAGIASRVTFGAIGLK